MTAKSVHAFHAQEEHAVHVRIVFVLPVHMEQQQVILEEHHMMIVMVSSLLLPPANEVWGKVIFSEVCVILSTGGEYLTRYTPRDQVHPPGQTPQVRHCPRTKYTPGTKYTPLGLSTPLGTKHTPRD